MMIAAKAAREASRNFPSTGDFEHLRSERKVQTASRGDQVDRARILSWLRSLTFHGC